MIVPRAVKAPPIKRVSAQNWLKGTVSAYDDGRMPLDGLKSAGNVVLDQDGTVKPRPSLVAYGPQPTGTILGEIGEFKNVSGLSSTNWMISMQNVAGTTKVYIAKGEDASWTVCNGKTYDNAASTRFVQIQNKVLVMNGVDTLSYLDIPSSAVIPYTALSNPSAPTLTTNTGLVGTNFNIYYRITANSSVGETAASAALTQPVLTDRDFWNPASQSIQIGWSAVTSAVSYNVYMGTVAGFEYLIARGVNGLTYTDNGSAAQDTTRLYPTTNSTDGPKVSRGSVINGRVFLVGDKDQPYYVRYGGDVGFELDFSPSNGGGFTPVGNGTKELPIAVKSFRDGKGTPQITVLCQGTSGRGKRYLLTADSLTFGSTVISFFDVTEDSGQDGTDSPDGVISYGTDLHYPSRDGFKTTGTLPNLQNVLSTHRTSNTIQTSLPNINYSAINKCVGIGFAGKLYWALPVASTTNNEIWTLDLDRGGAWMKPWTISADWLALYNDNSGTSHILVLSGNKVYELSTATLTNDSGTAFTTSGTSGLIKFSPDSREWGKLIQVIFTVLRPQGMIQFLVQGITEDSGGELVTVGTGSLTVTSNSSNFGWSEVTWSAEAWSIFPGVPSVSLPTSKDVIIDVDEELQAWEFSWSSSTTGVDYSLADVIGEYVEIGVRDLT